MIRRNIEELAIYELQEEIDSIDSTLLLNLYLEKTSDIVYLTLQGRLYGIVCLNDLLNHMEDGIVTINKKFSKMNCFDEEQARRIFSNNRFTKIPVVDETDCLLGDYSYLDDIDRVFVEWLTDRENIWVHLKKYLKRECYQKVYIVNPVKGKQYLKTYIVKVFETAKVSVTFIEKEELNVLMQNTEWSLIITTDLEELRGVLCINTISQFESNSKLKFMAFMNLFNHVANCARGRRFTTHHEKVNDSIIGKNLLAELQKKGITILAIYNDAYYVSDYIKNLFQKNLYHKKNYGNNRFWPVESEIGKEFFGELLENEDYRNGIAQRDIETGDLSLIANANYAGKYYNRIDGYRKTCYQPDQYCGKVYLFGPCMVRGSRVEDKYTIASQLQKKLNDEGYHYLVVNSGGPLEEDIFQGMCKSVFHMGDVIIIYTGFNTYENIESVEIRRVFEENNVPTGWCVELPVHMNHKATGLMVESLYDKLKKYLIFENSKNRVATKKEDIVIGMEYRFRLLKEFTKTAYLDTWFGSIDRQVIRGGILADFNIEPFMLEQVLSNIFTLVEELIVFVVPAENQLYTWREYVVAILKMSSSEHKIRLVLGDTFVPYKPILPSYYTNAELKKEAVVDEAKFFAECIAEPLNIHYRFGFGGSASNKIMQYNQIIKSELPKSGVQYIEF